MLVEQDRGRRIIYLSQSAYLDKVFKWFRMDECKGCATPMDVKAKPNAKREEEEVADKVLYQEAVEASLMPLLQHVRTSHMQPD